MATFKQDRRGTNVEVFEERKEAMERHSRAYNNTNAMAENACEDKKA